MSVSDFPKIQALIDAYAADAGHKHNGASLGVVVGAAAPVQPDGQLLFAGSLLDRSATPQPMALDGSTPFEIGSVSKVFTTGIFDMLAGRAALGATLSDLLGPGLGAGAYAGAITAAQLASFCSGLPQDNGHCALHPCTGYPKGMTTSLASLFDTLATYKPKDPKLQPGALYTYSNLGLSLLSMAALRLGSGNTDAFAEALNAALVNYCQLFGVDAGAAPTTTMYAFADSTGLPLGYDATYAPSNKPPCSAVEYGSGGVVSTGDDMLRFMLYQMSTQCAAYLQEAVSTLPGYCSGATGPTTGYGWFHRPFTTAGGGTVVAVCKDGGVSGFTAWIGIEQRAAPDQASPRGVFTLTNGPDAVALGTAAFGLLVGGRAGAADPTPDPKVH